MKGVSKKDLQERLEINLKNYDEDDPVISTLRWIIANCTELDPWLPIDENTPKDRPISLLWPQEIGGAMQGYWLCDAWYCDMWELTGSLMSNQPTHYKELPPDPKD